MEATLYSATCSLAKNQPTIIVSVNIIRKEMIDTGASGKDFKISAYKWGGDVLDVLTDELSNISVVLPSRSFFINVFSNNFLLEKER